MNFFLIEKQPNSLINWNRFFSIREFSLARITCLMNARKSSEFLTNCCLLTSRIYVKSSWSAVLFNNISLQHLLARGMFAFQGFGWTHRISGRLLLRPAMVKTRSSFNSTEGGVDVNKLGEFPIREDRERRFQTRTSHCCPCGGSASAFLFVPASLASSCLLSPLFWCSEDDEWENN